MIQHLLRKAALVAGLMFAACGLVSAAPITYAVELTTPAAVRYLDLQFLPGPGAAAATATISNFQLVGGGQLLPPIADVFPLPFNTPTATGTLATQVAIQNTSGFNAFLQRLQPGSALRFLVNLSGPALNTSGNAGGTDFSAFLYDVNGNDILGGPAVDLGIGANGGVTVVGSTVARVTVVPEPGSAVLFAVGVAALLVRRLRVRRAASAPAI